MKKFLKPLFLTSLFLLASGSVTSCYVRYCNELSSDETQEKPTAVSANTRNVNNADKHEADEEGISPYASNFLSLTYKALNHWDFEVEHEANQNGGFILNLTGEEVQGDLLAKTTIQGTNKLNGSKRLILTASADNAQQLIFGIADSNELVREVEVNLTEGENTFELFIGEVDFEHSFDVYLKAGETNLGKAVIRDINFSYFYSNNNQINPYVYEGEEEFNICSDVHNHWEVNGDGYEVNRKKVDQFELSYSNDELKEMYVKTTIVGHKGLKDFKSIVFSIKKTNINATNPFKIRIGDKERIFDYNSTILTLTLEDINVEENFDIYFIFNKESYYYSSTSVLNIERGYLSKHEVSAILTQGAVDEFDLLHNSKYHVGISDYHEELSYEDNGKVTFMPSENTKSDTAIYCEAVNITMHDYNKVRFVIRGPEGNVIRFSPLISNKNDYSQETREITLTGDEQEILLDVANIDSAFKGFFIMPMYSNENALGSFEIISAKYIHDERTFEAGSIIDKVGDDIVDITEDLKDYWEVGSNATISENGEIDAIFDNDNTDQIKLKIRRHADFGDYKYVNIKMRTTTTAYIKSVFEYSSTYSQSTSGNVMNLSFTGKGLDINNCFITLGRYNSNTTSLHIYGVELSKIKPNIAYTQDEHLDNLLVNYKQHWSNATKYTVEDDGVIINLPGNGENYVNYAPSLMNAASSFASLDLEFDAPGEDLEITPRVGDYNNSQPVTITADMTSISLPLNSNYNFNNNSSPKIGYFIRNNSGSDVNLKLKRIKLTPKA